MLIIALLSSTAYAADQATIDFQILPSGNNPNTTIDSQVLSNYLQQSGSVVQFSGISQTVETQLSATKCPTGTYSSLTSSGSQTCEKCPAGTASPITGASSAAACMPCSTGSFSLEQSAVCTDCAANTFSVTPAAPAITYCMKCPSNTTSPVHSSAIQMCICNPGFFVSDNVMNALPYDAVPVSMPLTGIVSTNVPHVSC